MRQVIDELEKIRRRSRFMLLAQRVFVLAAWIAAVLLVLVLTDYLLRLPGTVRLVLLVAGLGGLAAALWRYFRPAMLFRPRLTDLALRAEGIFPAVAGRLASSVEFAMAGVDKSNPLAARSVADTEQRLAGESLRRVISGERTWRATGVLLGTLAITATCAIVYPASAQTGLARIFAPFGTAEWPARTGVASLMHEVLAETRVHPRGQALALRARVTRGHPDYVAARYRLEVDGDWQDWQRIVLTDQGHGIHERLVDTTADEIELYFETRDAQTRRESVTLSAPPAVRRASLTVTPPSYAAAWFSPLEVDLGPGLDQRAVTETASLVGSDVTLVLELNKPIPPPRDEAALRETLGWAEGEPPLCRVDERFPRIWELRWRLAGTRALNLDLVDEFGLRNVEPIAYRVRAVEDRLPTVTIMTPEADEPVLPTAVVPLVAEARDDVAVSALGLEAAIEGKGDAAPEWAADDWAHAPSGRIETRLDLDELALVEGDVVLVRGRAEDVFELDGRRHPVVRSPARRLMIISELDLARRFRRELSVVRQNAIRIEARQAELEDDVMVDGVQPGIERAQAQIGERVAAQREAIGRIGQRMQMNRLEDEQLGSLIEQAGDLLDYAGRAANRAVEAIERRKLTGDERGEAPDGRRPPRGVEGSRGPTTPPRAERTPTRDLEGSAPGTADTGGTPGASGDERTPTRPAPGVTGAEQTPTRPAPGVTGGERTPTRPAPGISGDERTPTRPAPGVPGAERSEAPDDLDLDDLSDLVREPAEADRGIVDAQREVREELTDLITLLDRDEDTWVATRRLEELMRQQTELESDTATVGQRTLGRTWEELTAGEQSELDRMAQRQEDLAEQARQLLDDLRRRADELEEVDPQGADAMRSAADSGEQRELSRDMENAADRLGQNQMRTARGAQQAARQTLQEMLSNIRETSRANAQELLRRLASLIESIERLIVVQESELAAVRRALETGDFLGRDRAMIRLNQNTVSVAGEARTAGQESRRIARVLDRAADAQGAAVVALRATPLDGDEAEVAETRALDLLLEARELAEELEQVVEQREIMRQRNEIVAAYRELLEREVSVRGDTLELAEQGELDRRRLIEARGLGRVQEEIRTELHDVRARTREIQDSAIFSHVHELMDDWAREVSGALNAGTLDAAVTDRQQRIADSIGRLVKALEDLILPPEEFAKGRQQGGAGQGGQQPPPLVPPVAELMLLRGMQEQVYEQTREIDDRRRDLDAAERRARLGELGELQHELHELGQEMAEALQQGGGAGDGPQE